MRIIASGVTDRRPSRSLCASRAELEESILMVRRRRRSGSLASGNAAAARRLRPRSRQCQLQYCQNHHPPLLLHHLLLSQQSPQFVQQTVRTVTQMSAAAEAAFFLLSQRVTASEQQHLSAFCIFVRSPKSMCRPCQLGAEEEELTANTQPKLFTGVALYLLQVVSHSLGLRLILSISSGTRQRQAGQC